MFNHSCEPNCVAVFDGNVVDVRTITEVPADQEVKKMFAVLYRPSGLMHRQGCSQLEGERGGRLLLTPKNGKGRKNQEGKQGKGEKKEGTKREKVRKRERREKRKKRGRERKKKRKEKGRNKKEKKVKRKGRKKRKGNGIEFCLKVVTKLHEISINFPASEGGLCVFF